MLNFSYVKYTEFHIHVGNVCADIHMENNQDSIYHEEKYTGRLLNMKYFIFHMQKSAPIFSHDKFTEVHNSCENSSFRISYA